MIRNLTPHPVTILGEDGEAVLTLQTEHHPTGGVPAGCAGRGAGGQDRADAELGAACSPGSEEGCRGGSLVGV